MISITSGSNGIVVRNGRLSGGQRGVVYTSMTDSIRVRLEDLRFRNIPGEGITITRGGFVEILSCDMSNVATSTSLLPAGAIVISGTGMSGRLVANSVAGTFLAGISVTGLEGSEVARNEVRSTILEASPGLTMTGGGGNLVEDNVVAANSGKGIIVQSSNNPIRKNVVSRNREGGIAVFGDGNHIEENVENFNSSADAGDGIFVSGSCNLVRGNEVSGNTTHGIRIFSGTANFIDGNAAQNNPLGCGIQIDNTMGHAYRNNMLRGNGIGSACGCPAGDPGGNIL